VFTTSLKDRIFKRKITINKTGCWIWHGHRSHGYGYIWVYEKKHTISVSRAIWLLKKGPIPDGLFICHKCDNPACINPDHLFLGTNEENIQDMIDKGRNAKGEKHGNSKLKVESVRTIRSMAKSHIATHEQIAKQFSISVSLVNAIIYKQRWKHVE